jgi:large subunit ribosomal protein L31
VKPEIHPEYREVVFQDTSSDLRFITRSTISTSETVEIDGETYPLAKVEISSASHPFYTGKQILVDSGGRVERFRRRYKKVGMETEGSGARAAVKKASADAEPNSDTES